MNKKDEIKKKFVSENIKNATKFEKLMRLKLQCCNISYEFQYSIDYNGRFIICDFYIPKYGLIIEIDGGYHTSIYQTMKDIDRDAYLRQKGYKVLRIFNEDVDTFDTKTIKTLYPTIKQKLHKYTLSQKAFDKKNMDKESFKKKYKV